MECHDIQNEISREEGMSRHRFVIAVARIQMKTSMLQAPTR